MVIFQKGFSLLELVFAIVIIGLISAVALPKLGNLLSYTSQSRAEALASDLRHAKELAASGGRCVSVGLNYSGGIYTLVASKPVDATYPPCNGSTVIFSSALDANTTVTGPASPLYFNSVGQPNASATYSVGSGGSTKYVGITAVTGLVVVCASLPCPPL